MTLAVLAATGAGAATWGLLGSGRFAVRAVEVVGTARVAAPQVRAAAGDQLGRPLVLVDTDRVAARVGALPGVLDASVTRVWPSTLRVAVRERAVAAALRLPGGGVRLVDATGAELERPARAPAGVPVVEVAPAAGEGAVAAAAAVVSALPPEVRALVRTAGAASAESVWLRLRDGARVEWGSSRDGGLKAAVLLALRRSTPGRGGVVYVVSAPTTPAVEGATHPGGR